MGWYGNNCPETHGWHRGPKTCGEHGKLPHNWPPALKGDVAALLAANFSSIKLDNPGCGTGDDMQGYYDAVHAASPRPIVIENCKKHTLPLLTFSCRREGSGGRTLYALPPI